MKKLIFLLAFCLNLTAMAADTLHVEIKDTYDLASYGNIVRKAIVLTDSPKPVHFELNTWAEIPHYDSYKVHVTVVATKVSEGRYAVQFVKKLFLKDGRSITTSDKFLALTKGSKTNFDDSYWDISNLALRQENTLFLN
jgi:hypothetical protein